MTAHPDASDTTPSEEMTAAVDHAHELLRRLGYHRESDHFVNVNRVGAEAIHISTIATIVHAALLTVARQPTTVCAGKALIEQVLVPVEFLKGFYKLAHNYSLNAEAPDYYWGTERDAFANAYRRCGQDLAELKNKLPTAPASPGLVLDDVGNALLLLLTDEGSRVSQSAGSTQP